MGAYSRGLQSNRFEIEDDELDELAETPQSSPFFPQPTQTVNHATTLKATDNTRTADHPKALPTASPTGPSSPGSSEIEVPASSPFQKYSRAGSTATASRVDMSKPALNGQIGGPPVGRLAHFMAPAGTTFRAPAKSALQSRQLPAPSTAKSLNRPVGDDLSDDDDLAKDNRRDTRVSSEDRAQRADIQPASFKQHDRSQVTSSVARPMFAPPRARHSTLKPIESLNDIPELRLRYLTKETLKCVRKRLPTVTIAEARDAVVKNGWLVESATEYLLDKSGLEIGYLHGMSGESKTPSTASSIAPAITARPTSSTTASSNSEASEPTAAPRQKRPNQSRRLIQDIRNKSSALSASPGPSSRSSPATTLSRSASAKAPDASEPGSTTTVSPPRQSPPPKKRRRLVRGSRESRKPSPVRYANDDSDSDDELPTLGELAHGKRKATEASKPVKSQKAVTDTRNAAKVPTVIMDDSDNSETFLAEFTDTDSAEDDASVRVDGEEESVLGYLKTCSAEELARIASIPVADATLVVAARPFNRLDAVRKVKSNSNKITRSSLGVTVVEKLLTWFKAFKSASAVIKECEKRGAQINSVMSTWNTDRNGRTRDEDASLVPLPISKRPALMDESVQLKSYQLLGLNWMNLLHSCGHSGILADDMGLGKTCQVIAFIAHLVKYPKRCKRRPWPNLIVVPPSTLENWMSEFDRFAPDIKVFPYSGSQRRNIDAQDVQDQHVVLTSYSQIERNVEDREWLRELEPYAAIFDEGHKLKNPETQVYKQLITIPSTWRLVLSGTPVQNNLKELLSLLHFVDQSLFRTGTFNELQTIFEVKVASKDVHNFAALAKERVGNARTIMAPFILQRRKDDVLELPKKTERRIVVGMHPEQKLIYDDLQGDYLSAKGVGRGRAKVNKKESGNRWMQLRKAAIHHQLFRRHFTDKTVMEMTNILWKKCSAEELYVQSKEDRHKALFQAKLMDDSDFALHLWCKDFKRYIGHLDIAHRSWEEAPKVRKVLELVQEYKANGDRVLIFSRFEMVIDILRETLHSADIRYCELTGMSGVSSRFPEIEKFNNTPDIPVFLLTTGAGGTGLNLTAANKIIIFDQSDNPQDDVQASNRAHRIGQTREVEVIRIITENTVEGFVYISCKKKLKMAASVEGNAELNEDEETVEDMCRQLMSGGGQSLVDEEDKELVGELMPLTGERL